MRLTFNVIWFENQPNEIKPAADALKKRLEQHGFELNLQIELNDSRVEELSEHQEKYHDSDLVVVDFDLGEDCDKGDVIARRIRNAFSFTDIIFYSGSKPDELRGRVKDQAIDGVYCMSRNDLRAQLLARVDDIVLSLSRLESMRGLAAVTAGRGDDYLRSILSRIHEIADNNERNELIATIDEEVKRTAARNADRYAKHETLDARLGDFACTSMALLKAAKSMVGKHPKLAAEREVLGQYQPEVIEIRNKFSHIVEQRTDDGWVIVGKDTSLTREDFPNVRTNFSRHLVNLARIEAIISDDGN